MKAAGLPAPAATTSLTGYESLRITTNGTHAAVAGVAVVAPPAAWPARMLSLRPLREDEAISIVAQTFPGLTVEETDP